ncbi:hypothetical protein PRIP_11764 [Listeria riparia FSL S10-1204]|uniref:Uncharacterized protein n=1 Tax=Listeria riparia FSL S10-1204 TaxID=1265816 RepID=W7CVF8_9LIST|nr:hypothetical protein [Listeria riparia]EUJ43644.1 hypothetical protein PRIP_11764 [Listeria riparia FSL S10-1204]
MLVLLFCEPPVSLAGGVVGWSLLGCVCSAGIVTVVDAGEPRFPSLTGMTVMTTVEPGEPPPMLIDVVA